MNLKLMLTTIHQPEHLPWLGFFHKMAQAEKYIYLDNVQYEKNYFQNRNRLVNRQGTPYWMTVPVCLVGHMTSTIGEMKIDNAQPWRRKYWGRLQETYCRHAHFETYETEMRAIIEKPFELLIDLNLAWIDFFRLHLGIQNQVVRASSLIDSPEKSTDLLLVLCQKAGASRYLSGPSGRDYLDIKKFEMAGIPVEFHEFSHPTYPAKNFVKGLSTLDLLMNCGDDSRAILLGQNITSPVEKEGHELPA